MGAWGLASFDNDDAIDWLHELERTDDFTLVRQTLLLGRRCGVAVGAARIGDFAKPRVGLSRGARDH